MWDIIVNFFTAAPWWELLLIFFAKLVEVTIGTMRIILISKGYRKPGTILAIFEILLWVFVASSVISGILEAPIKGVVYSLGFAVGVYIGSLIEGRLAIGRMIIHVITSVKNAPLITSVLREQGHGVTEINAKGKQSDRIVLLLFVNRKNRPIVMKLIEETDPKAVIAANEVSLIQGGFVSPWRKLAK